MAGREWTERHIVELIVKHGGALASTRSSSTQSRSASTITSSSPQQADAVVEAFRASRRKGDDNGDS